MINYLKNFKLLSLVTILLIVNTGCSSDDDKKNDESSLKVQLATTNDFGSILVDQENHSLYYFFASDVTGVSTCKGGCAEV